MKNIRTVPVVAVFVLLTLMGIAPSQAQWVQTMGPRGGHIQCLANNAQNIFAGTADSGVFRSTDNGLTWAATSAGLINTNVVSLAAEGSTVCAGTVGGIYLSNDNGATWTPAGLSHTYISTLTVIGGTILAGTDKSMLRSTDDGVSWTAVMTDENIQVIVAHGSTLYAGTTYVAIIVPFGVSSVTSYAGVFTSTDSGATWTSAGLFGAEVYSLAFMGNDLYASTYAGVGKVFLSTNIGVTWTVVDTALTQFPAHLAVRGTNLFAGTWWNGVFLSTNNGADWKTVTTGLMDTLVTALLVNGTTLFAGTYSGGVWRRPLSEMTTGVDVFSAETPKVFKLEQNFPNPFNPATTIRYALPSRSHVTLTVFNTIGQQVATLVNESEDAGLHDVRFDGTGFASGVYFYRLKAGDFIQSKKLLILR